MCMCVYADIFPMQTHSALAMQAESTIAIKTEKVEHALATHKTIDFRCERPRVTTGALITWPAANRKSHHHKEGTITKSLVCLDCLDAGKCGGDAEDGKQF